MDAAEQAFDDLVSHRSQHLLRCAYLLTGDWALAEDLLQTALTKTYLRWHRLRDLAAGEAYVRRVLVTTYTKWWRRKWHAEVPTAALPDAPAGDRYAGVDDRDELARALSSLSPRARSIVVLRFFADLTEAQVADELGCSVGTVKSTVSRSLVRLREHVNARDGVALGVAAADAAVPSAEETSRD